jgi:DNA primase
MSPDATPEIHDVRASALDLCARALRGEGGRATREGVLSRKQLGLTVRDRALGYYPGAASLAKALMAAGHASTAIRASSVLRRDVEDALIVPWPDRDGRPGGLVFRRNTAIIAANPYGETEIRYALQGDRDRLPLDGAIPARAAGHERLVVVEGTTDFLVLAQAGVTDVATPHTCAIRPAQLIHLRDLGFRQLTVCFDADFAGFRGMLSAIEGAFACGLSVSVVRPEREGEDLDELVNRAGVPAFRALLAQTEDGLEAYARAILLAAKSTEDPRATVADLAARFAQLAPDEAASASLETGFGEIIDAEIGTAARRAAADRVAAAAGGRRLQLSPIGSLLRNRSGSARPSTGS